MSVRALDSTDAEPGPVAAVPDREASGPLERYGWIALVLLAPAALLYLSFNAGGYFPAATGYMAVAFAAALVLRTTLAERPFEGLTPRLAVPLVALALYAAFQLASALWSQALSRTLDSFDRSLLYLLALLLFGSFRYARAHARWLVRAVLAGLTAACLSGLISRVLPHLWPTSSSFFEDRLNYPLTYWNAEGLIAALVLILGFHLTADREEPAAIRVAAAAVLPGVAATLLLTYSRGAMGVCAIGLLAYCLLARWSTLPSALLAVAVPVAIAVRSAWDATALSTNHPTGSAAVSEGHHVALVVALCMVGAGALRALLLLLDGRVAELGPVRRPPPRRVLAGAGAAVGAIVLACALAAGAAGFVEREYDKFVHGDSGLQVAHVRERLSDPANNGRLSLWKAAVYIYDSEKLRGTGAGTYQQYYQRYRTERLYVVDAHSLYLQSLAELGLVGFVLILVVVLGSLTGIASRIRGPDRGMYAALFAATLAWAVHQAVDWDWQMPATTLPIAMLAGMALAARRGDGSIRLSGLPLGRTLVALGWVVLAVCPLLGAVSYARVQSAGEALKRGDCVAAKQHALDSLSLSARRPAAYEIVGVCDLEQGFAQAAVPAMSQAAGLEPQSWEAHYWLAVALAAAGQDPHAAIRRAVALNPLEYGLRHAAQRLRGADPRAWERAAPRLRVEALISGKFTITNL